MPLLNAQTALEGGTQQLDSEEEANATLELLGITLEDVVAELDFRRNRAEQKMHVEMAAAARAGGERRTFKVADAGGEVQFMVHPLSYHYWGARLGYKCWQDAQFVREYLRDNPAARVRSRSANLTMLRPDLAPNKTRAPLGRRGRWAA